MVIGMTDSVQGTLLRRALNQRTIIQNYSGHNWQDPSMRSITFNSANPALLCIRTAGAFSQACAISGRLPWQAQCSNQQLSHRARDARRYLQTNNLQRTLPNAGPERWSFNFNPERKPTPSKRPVRDSTKLPTKETKQVEKTTVEIKELQPKWSTYSMPSKGTLQKQQEQAEKQNQETQRILKSEPTPTAKRQKRKLRPRKALIALTPNAITHLRLLLNQPEPKLIRIGVKNRGCSGLTYDLQYTSEPGKFDEVVEQDGVKVVIDSKALFSIVGSEMDWIDDRLSSRFVFKNPNSKGTCGCGES